MIVLASRADLVRRRWGAGLKRFTVEEVQDARRLETILAAKAPATGVDGQCPLVQWTPFATDGTMSASRSHVIEEAPMDRTAHPAGVALAKTKLTMSPATSVTYDRLRWWIVGAALFAAAVCAVSVANDVDAVSADPPQISAEP